MDNEIWKVKGEGEPVIEIWEHAHGHLWFVTEKLEGTIRFGYARYYHMPQFAEWGYFDIQELLDVSGKNMVWKVSKENWENINSYEEGLLVKVQETKEP